MIEHYGLEPSRVVVLRNAIAPPFERLFADEQGLVRAKGSRLILAYTTIPFRGLDVLLSIFPDLRLDYPEAELHVYSSMKVYQHDEATDPGRALYEQCRSTPGVKYLGSVSQSVLAQALAGGTILSYPSTVAETSCIVVMEALAAGLHVVTSNLGALPETTMGFGTLVPANAARDRNQFARDYLTHLRSVLQRWADNPEAFAAQRFPQVKAVNDHCTWQRRAAEWEQVLRDYQRPGGQRSPTGDNQGVGAVNAAVAIPEAMATALAHHQAGRLEQAEQIYRRILQSDSGEPNALLYLGLIAHQLGRHEEAVKHMTQAIRRAPGHVSAHNNLGLVLVALGRLEEAAASLREAVRLKPDFAAAHNNLALVLVRQGRFDEALTCCRQALELKPDFAETLYHLGVVLQSQGKTAEAVASYRRALELKPSLAEAHHDLGDALRTQGKLDEAAAHHQRALSLQREHAEAFYNQGATLAGQGRLAEAAASYEQALRFKPDYAEAHNNLGNALLAQGKLDEAVACYRRALELKPELVVAHNNLGNALTHQWKLEEAVACYRRALELKSDDPDAFNNLGNALTRQGKLEEGTTCYRRALDLKPSFAEAQYNLGNVLKDQGEVSEAISCYQRVLHLNPGMAAAYSNLLLILQYRPGITLRELAEAHADYERRYAASLRPTWTPHDNARDPERRLRLGFLSPDLRDHPVGYFLIRVLENLDPRQAEAFCYYDDSTKDHLTARFQGAATTWADVYGWHDERLAEQIRADRIDILFDLAGHTAKGRLLVFARKPAPIQVTWAGYVGTTGLKAMDFILADRYQIPPEAEAHYVERVLRMPDGYVCYDPPAYAPAVSALPALERGYVTFGSFNNPAKINQQVVAIWAKILQRLPQARLVLKYKGLDDSAVANRLAALFAEHRIDSGRVDFLGKSPHAEFLAHYRHIDIGLDPFPYSGGLTTCEALWMGIPVITCPGETFASRHSLTHLANMGLREMIAGTLDEYVESAVFWAGDLRRLTEMRAGLRQRVAPSPLCDGKRFAENFVQVLRGVWREWAGAPETSRAT
jgi:predicted O-linked N-acetylglucosamine transferase (SPINDLY family)